MACFHPSTSSVALTKLDFPVPYSSNISKIHVPSSSSNPCKKSQSIHRGSSFRKTNKFVASSLVTGNPSVDDEEKENQNIPLVQVKTSKWKWRGYSIRYQFAGDRGPALVLIHGFGANSDHWRKNIPILAESHRVFAIDLIGYGYSDKPNPHKLGVDSFYTFETWGSQINDFCRDVVRDEAFFICNSIGGVVGLQAAVLEPQLCKGVLVLNISLRMLHITKQPRLARPFIKGFQELLRSTALGKFFFKSVATPEAVKNILCQCYHDTAQVTDELVEKILLPGLEPGAADVFLEFICYSGGPLPEDLLPQVKCPVLVAWGDKDPWEPIELGRAYGNFDTVEDFIALPGVGHCPQHMPIKHMAVYGETLGPRCKIEENTVPAFLYLRQVRGKARLAKAAMDEAPHIVNPIINSFVARHAKSTRS